MMKKRVASGGWCVIPGRPLGPARRVLFAERVTRMGFTNNDEKFLDADARRFAQILF